MSYRNTASAVTVPAPICLESRAPAQSPEAIYQEIAVRQCRRHQTERGEDWPTCPPPAASRYPNILAELDGSGRWLDHIARCAEVSQPIMAAVMVEEAT